MTLYDGSYIDNFLRFILYGNVYQNMTVTRTYSSPMKQHSSVRLRLEGEANFSHFYALELETMKVSNNLTANLVWDRSENGGSYRIDIDDMGTSFGGTLTGYKVVWIPCK